MFNIRLTKLYMTLSQTVWLSQKLMFGSSMFLIVLKTKKKKKSEKSNSTIKFQHGLDFSYSRDMGCFYKFSCKIS